MLDPEARVAKPRSFSDSLIALVFPQACSICGGAAESLDDGAVCARCWEEYERTVPTQIGCERCGWPTCEIAPRMEQGAGCQRCRRLDFDLLRYLGPYRGALRVIALTLKRRPHLPGRVRRMVKRKIQAESILRQCDLIIPVPLHAERIRERGFNQAEVLASKLSRDLARPLDLHTLNRVVGTRRHRAGMDARERAVSLSGAFAVDPSRALKDRRVLLVDDVFTTGATIGECVRALKAAGASCVCAFTLARVVD